VVSHEFFCGRLLICSGLNHLWRKARVMSMWLQILTALSPGSPLRCKT